MGHVKYYFPGSLLILIAIMIMAVPEILVVFLAASILMAGIGALYIGHMIRKSEIEFRDFDEWLLTDDSPRWRLARAPVFRKRNYWI